MSETKSLKSRVGTEIAGQKAAPKRPGKCRRLMVAVPLVAALAVPFLFGGCDAKKRDNASPTRAHAGSLAEDVKKAREHSEYLAGEMEIAHGQLRHLRGKTAALDAKEAELEKESKKLDKTAKRLKAEIAAIKEETESLKAEVKAKERKDSNEINALRQKLAKKKEELAAMDEKLERQQAENAKMMGLVDKTEAFTRLNEQIAGKYSKEKTSQIVTGAMGILLGNRLDEFISASLEKRGELINEALDSPDGERRLDEALIFLKQYA